MGYSRMEKDQAAAHLKKQENENKERKKNNPWYHCHPV